MSETVQFLYRNHKGNERLRIVRPLSLDFIQRVGYNYQPGWFLTAYDLDKKAVRSFRLSHIVLDSDASPIAFRIKLGG